MKLTILLSSILLFAQAVLASVLIDQVVRVGEEEKYSYDPDADNGPIHWGSLSEDFAQCDAGNAQSPINVIESGVHNLGSQSAPIVRPQAGLFSFSSGTFNFALNCVFEGRCGSTIFNGKQFDVINLHFHAPSEHTVNGVHYPLEAHMVHSASDGSLLVIGTMFTDKVGGQSGSSNDLLVPPTNFASSQLAFHLIVDNIGSEGGRLPINMPTFIGDSGYCTYDGSLTTPPCSEGVTWLIALQEQAVATSDIELFETHASSAEFGNNRPVHPLNTREVSCFRSSSGGLGQRRLPFFPF